MSNKKEYFYGLNLLRFLLSIAIILCHYRMVFLEQYLKLKVFL